MRNSFFNSLDYFYIGLTFLSCMVGFVRGFIKDFFSTCAWVGSGFLSAFISPYLAHSFQAGGMSNPTLAKLTAIAISYLVILATFLLTIGLISGKVKNTVLSGIDRALGSLFGLGRGIVILITVCIIAVMFNVLEKDYKFVNNSKLTPYLLEITDELMPKIIQWTPKYDEKSKQEEIISPQEDVEEPLAADEQKLQEEEREGNTEHKKVFLMGQLKQYVSNILTKYFERREGVEDEDKSQKKKFRRKVVNNKDENVEFGCMDLMKARAQRRAQKKAIKLKREIMKRIDKKPL